MNEEKRLYFACAAPEDIGRHLTGKLEVGLGKVTSELRELFRNAYRHYYGRDWGFGITSGVMRGGEQGELAVVRINHARALAKRLLGVVTAAKLTWRPQARNSDTNALAATLLASQLLEDAWKTKHVAQSMNTLVEQAIAFSEAFLFTPWDLALGPPLMTRTLPTQTDDKGAPAVTVVNQGDVAVHNILPWDVIRERNQKSYKECLWKIVRMSTNKWNLARLYPTDILGQPTEIPILSSYMEPKSGSVDVYAQTPEESDLVPVYYFMHEPCPVLPKGRLTIFIADKCVLKDVALTDEYDEMPLYRLAADEMFNTPFAWTQFWDALGIQEVSDSLNTTVATNLTSLGTQCIGVQVGSEQKPDDVAGGMRVWWYPPGAQPPVAVQLAKCAPETFPYLETLKGDQQQIMGLNDVVQGTPDEKLSGSAMALLSAMAIQNATPFQAAFVDCASKVGTGYIKTICKRVSVERQLAVTGRGSKYLYSQRGYTGKDVESVSNVLVDIGNPLEQTAAGRLQILQDNMKLGFVKTPEQYQMVLDTGRLEPATDATRNELMLLKAESDALMRGESPPVDQLQNHLIHGSENHSVLDNLDALSNPQVVQAVHAHLDAHYQAYFGMDPHQDPQVWMRYPILLGQKPPPSFGPPPPPMPMMGAAPPGPVPPQPPHPGVPAKPGAHPGAAPPPGKHTNAVTAPQTPLGNGGAQPMMPQMPMNKTTGQRFDPTTGGGMVPPQISG